MSTVRRTSVLVGAVLTALAMLMVVQGLRQEAETQPAPGEEPSFSAPTNAGFAKDQVIVTLEEGATQADLRQLNAQTDATVEENLPASDVNVVDLPRDLGVREAVERYENSPDIEYAEPDFLLQPAATPDDPGYSDLWGLNNTGQTVGGQAGVVDADIDAPEAWDVTTGDASTVVAVIDEGIDTSHPDLRDNIWRNPDEVPGDGLDNDGNTYVDDVNGYDFRGVGNNTVYDPDPLTGKGDEHGTHVAGTIAATGNNGKGVTGVNWDAQVASLKFLGPDGGFTSDAVEAINYAVREKMPISNNSWGGGGKSQALQDAIASADAAGHLFVAAAGNGGSDKVGDDNDATPHYPSSYDNPNVVAVAATDNRDQLAPFSNFGATSVDLAAPGVDTLSTLPGNRYAYYSGTSMATPHVTGVAALIKSQQPGADDAQMKAQILQYVDKKSSLQGKVATNGRLNALRAVTENADTTKPTVSSPRPIPGSKTRDRTPTVSATVRDDRTELQKSNIRLYLDGKARGTFSYYPGTDRLVYTTPRLSYARHTVRIVARDAVGNAGARSWRFTVVR